MHGHGGGVPSQQPMAPGFPGFVGSQPPFQNAFPFHGVPNGGQPQLPPQLAQQQLGYHNFFQQPVQQLQLATTLNPFNGHLVASTGPPTPGYALVSNNTQVVPRQQPMQNQNMAHHMVPTPVPAPVHHHRHSKCLPPYSHVQLVVVCRHLLTQIFFFFFFGSGNGTSISNVASIAHS